ncbi:MAG TPA: hypothetical protein VK631_23375 [Solirubrobacteraceae bacterium]|nr:hypothetical protein [Solirubrobacteraceae bacterium]
MRSPLHIAAGFLLAFVVHVPAASAGEYAVTACFGTENASWSEWKPTPGATAYNACPGGVIDVARPQSGAGMVARNVAGPAFATAGTTAALTFDAPAGTSITGIDFDARMLTNPGWSAGVFDATRGAWLWCGARCFTTGEHWVHKELRGLATQRLQALVRCDAARCRSDVRRAVIALRNTRVYLADGSAPGIGGLRGALGAGDGWLRGVADVAYDAGDNSGIRTGRVELDGRAVHEDERPCDFTRPVPCSDASIGALLDTRTWADGAHALRLGAMDAAGNWTWVDRTVRVDNSPPPEPAPVLDGGAEWSPQRTRTLALPLPSGQAAPLVRARVKGCRVGAGCAEAAPELTAAGSAAASVPVTAFDGPGEYSVRLALEDAAGNVGPYAAPVTLRFDDARPGAPDVSAADRWHSGGALPLDAEGDRPVSGIRGYRVRIGGREAVVATSLPLDELPEGGTPVEVRAVSGAGVESTAVRTTLKLDRTRPIVTADGVPAPDAWSRVPVRIALRGRDQAGLSGMQSLAWTIDAGEEESRAGDEAAIDVAGDGRHTVGYRAVDAAGNSSTRHTVAVRVDRTPPETVAFEAPDPADPTLVRVVVADATSGVAGGRVELRRAGADWRRVATSLEAGRLVTRLDDAALRSGAYELRAVVTDVAGNEAVGTRRSDGSPAAVTLPLRRRTAVSVRRSGRALRARLTLDGGPLAGREVELAQRLRGRATWRPVCGRTIVIAASATARAGIASPSAAGSGCALRTDAAGRVEVRLPAGPSRTLRVSFPGDALLLPARGSASVRTSARARVRATPRTVAAGGAVRFTGRLRGGHVPRSGKLVELQARIGAGWRTFATLRTDRRGGFRHSHRFATVSGGRTYWFRLRVPREAAYPFEQATTRPLAVRVA